MSSPVPVVALPSQGCRVILLQDCAWPALRTYVMNVGPCYLFSVLIVDKTAPRAYLELLSAMAFGRTGNGPLSNAHIVPPIVKGFLFAHFPAVLGPRALEDAHMGSEVLSVSSLLPACLPGWGILGLLPSRMSF